MYTWKYVHVIFSKIYIYNCLRMNGTQDKNVTYIYSFYALVELLAFGLEGLLCRHNEPVSEQHDGPKTKGFFVFHDNGAGF